MAELHEALKTLGPVDFSDVPVDSLDSYLRHAFEAGELICNSVPPPPGGIDFSQAQPATSAPDSASSANEIKASEARPSPPHPQHADLQKSWGKPLKLSAKENQLGFNVYKMAGKDRHGAWFARRSVHEGMSFTKFKKAMQREFAESLTVQGGPGEGNVRGIGGDRRLEKRKVEAVDGQMEVFQLSAQFPGPTTPREFITLLLTGENALTDKSSEQDTGKEAHIPRHFMVVSKPVTHPDAPERSGYVRGSYESVEMIREIPINRAPSKETAGTESESLKHELNPVEWIMITRSDPGGGIPRFMVERGTPSSICADAVKFLDWACAKDEIPDADADEEQQAAAQAHHDPSPAQKRDGVAVAGSQQEQSQSHQTQQADGGIVSHLTNALEAGIETYAPTSVAAYAHQYLHQDDDSDTSSDSDETHSFASAQDFHPDHEAPVGVSTQSLAMSSTSSLPESTMAGGGPSHHDKELAKLDEKKQKLDVKLAKKREAEDEKFAAHKQKDSTDEAKLAEKHEREVKKIEERRAKELAKIEAKKEKELRKAEKKRQKTLDSETLSRLTRERDDFRYQADSLRRENGLLRDQTGDLQRENQILVNKLAKLGGTDVLKSIKQDVESGRARSSSTRSRTEAK
ncbi:hypothetical protein MBLNU459_g3578t1 [Dothideomycetes sp. NU459]